MRINEAQPCKAISTLSLSASHAGPPHKRLQQLTQLWQEVKKRKLEPLGLLCGGCDRGTFVPVLNRAYILISTQGRRRSCIVETINISFSRRPYNRAS